MQRIVQLAAKAVLFHQIGQIDGGGGNHLHIHRDQAPGVEAGEHALLNYLQQGRLQLRRQILDLFQKQGAAVGQLKAAQATIFIVGRGAAHKILAQHAVGIQLAVDGDIGAARPFAFIVDSLAQQLFPNPLFTAQQHREASARRLAAKVDQASGFRIVGRHLLKGVAHFTELAGHQLPHLLHRMQQQNKTVALRLDNRF